MKVQKPEQGKYAVLYKIIIISALLGVVGHFSYAAAADLLVQPGITIAEEYNDNIYETSNDKKSDFITHVIPAIAFKYSTAFWEWDTSYALDYGYYSRISKDQTTHSLAAKGLVKLIDEFMFLEISDTYRRASLDVTRDVTKESSTFNQSDQNIFTVSPYFVLRPTAATKVKTGYRYSNVWYHEPSGVDKSENSLFAEGTYDLSSNTSLVANYVFTHQDTVINDLDKHELLAGVRHEYLDKCFVYAQAGKSWLSFSSGDDSSDFIWNAGISHALETVNLSVEVGARYNEDPLRNIIEETFYIGKAVKTFDRGQANLSVYYSEYDNVVSTSTDLQTNKIGTGMGVKYELLPNLTGTANFSLERFDYSGGAYTRRIYTDYGVNYLMPRDFTVALSHKYYNYFSPDVASDNRELNRVILELRKVF